MIDWDLFQCRIIYFVTLSTDATFCDLRHNCISKINSHLWNRAQFLVEIITIFFVTYSTMFYSQFHNFKQLWPIPQLQVIVTNSTVAPVTNSTTFIVTYSSTPSRPYSVPPKEECLATSNIYYFVLCFWCFTHFATRLRFFRSQPLVFCF